MNNELFYEDWLSLIKTITFIVYSNTKTCKYYKILFTGHCIAICALSDHMCFNDSSMIGPWVLFREIFLSPPDVQLRTACCGGTSGKNGPRCRCTPCRRTGRYLSRRSGIRCDRSCRRKNKRCWYKFKTVLLGFFKTSIWSTYKCCLQFFCVVYNKVRLWGTRL